VGLSDEYQCLFISNIRYLFQKYVQKFLVIGIHRTTFVIDENGIIDEVISEVNTKAQTAQILKWCMKKHAKKMCFFLACLFMCNFI
jgi:peroxiredoxin